ncbi:MAG: AAA family ATPase [Caldilinea sp.]|jgi:hypothetical protein
MSLILNRYLPTYRQETLKRLFTVIEQGGSFCLVGLAGTGKSNLCQFLEQPAVSAHYLPQPEAARTHFLTVSCGTGTQSTHQIYQALLVALQPLAQQLELSLPQLPEKPSIYELRNLLKLLCAEPDRNGHNRRIVFVLDEFENLIRHQTEEFFEELRQLRDEHRTSGNLAYVVLTHRMPQVLKGADHKPFQKSRLLELLHREIHPLGPYCNQDACQMLESLLSRARLSLSPASQKRLCTLCGCHSGILRALFDALQPQLEIFTPLIILRLAGEHPEVNRSCEHLWSHLHGEERSALLDLAQGKHPAPSITTFLLKRGLLTHPQSPIFFSPIFDKFVKTKIYG